MKTLLLLAVLLSPLARADEEPAPVHRLELDLDGVLAPDLAEILPGDADHEVLQVTLVPSGKKFVFTRLLRHFKGDTCSELGSHSLAAGPGRTLEWTRTSGDWGVCRYVDKNTFRFRLERDELRLVSAHFDESSWSMGSVSPNVTTDYDFLARKVSVRVEEHHEGNTDAKATETMRPGCAATATSIDANGFPMCAAQQAYFMREELFPEWGAGDRRVPVCPSLAGSYLCTRTDTPEHYQSRKLAIHRVESRVNRYDVSGNPFVLVADGKRRLVKRDSTTKDYETTSCKRERLSTLTETWYTFGADHPNQPLYDRFAARKELATWTQLDLAGERFSYVEESQSLESDGTYRSSLTYAYECVKERDPE